MKWEKGMKALLGDAEVTIIRRMSHGKVRIMDAHGPTTVDAAALKPFTAPKYKDISRDPAEMNVAKLILGLDNLDDSIRIAVLKALLQ